MKVTVTSRNKGPMYAAMVSALRNITGTWTYLDFAPVADAKHMARTTSADCGGGGGSGISRAQGTSTRDR